MNELAKKIRNAYEAMKQLRDHLLTMPGDHAKAKAKEVDGAMAILSEWCEQVEYDPDETPINQRGGESTCPSCGALLPQAGG